MSALSESETLRLKFQRDLNCLADHDRMVRRKGMQRLRAVIQDPKTDLPLIQGSKELMVTFFNKHLRDILVQSFADSLEFCRETSLKLVLMFATELLDSDDLSVLAVKCIPALVERVGISPSPETTEEIRLLAVRLLDVFVKSPTALTLNNNGDSIGDGVSAIITRSLSDLYPDVKRLCATCVRHVVANYPSIAVTHGVELMKACVANLGHQHAKTRQLTLQALGQLVVCCSHAAACETSSEVSVDLAVAAEAASGSSMTMNDTTGFAEDSTNEAALASCLRDVVMPAFHKIVDDSSASVRLTLARCNGFLIRARPLKTQGIKLLGLESPILAQLLAITSDTADEVQRAAFEALSQAAVHFAEHTPNWEGSHAVSPLPPRSHYVCSSQVEEVEEAAYSSKAVFALVASHVPTLMAPLLEATSSWTVRGKVRALNTLKVITLIGRGDRATLGPCLPNFVTSIARCLCDDEEEVVIAARRCAAAVGCGASAEAAIALSLPRARGEGAGMDTPQSRTAGLLVASALIDGSSDPANVTAEVCETLGSFGLLLQGWDTELGLMDRELAAALLQCCDVIVRRGCEEAGYFRSKTDKAKSQVIYVLLAIFYLAGLPTEAVVEGTSEDALNCASVLAECLFPGDTPLTTMYSALLPQLLKLILSPQASIAHLGGLTGVIGVNGFLWENRDPSRRAFDALLRSAAAAAGPSLSQIVPVITAHVTTDCKPDLKLSMLCLLEALLEQSPSWWPPLVVGIVNDILMHNMVWKAGRVASTIRKVSIASFYSILHRGYADRSVLFKIAPPLLPVLKTDLDDYDASTRELVCLSLDLMFRALPNALSEQPVLELYPALLKRLDDSSDQVRFAVCGCFLSFLKSAPPSAFAGTTIDYTLDQLLVHLDDVDPAIQERIFKVLRVTLTIEPDRVANKAEAVRSAHRSPLLIDQLITLAKDAT